MIFGRAAKMPFRKSFAYEANYHGKKNKKAEGVDMLTALQVS